LAPGKTVYSNNITIKNNADDGGGVILDMFISGTDFHSSSIFSYCPEQQTLSLNRFRYYAENGVYNTSDTNLSNQEGFRPINYGGGFNNPNLFYNSYEIIPKDTYMPNYEGVLEYNNGPYYHANELEPDQEIKVKFKLDIPAECHGTFEQGNIYFWGEAI
jgi:hypothetical protein